MFVNVCKLNSKCSVIIYKIFDEDKGLWVTRKSIDESRPTWRPRGRPWARWRRCARRRWSRRRTAWSGQQADCSASVSPLCRTARRTSERREGRRPSSVRRTQPVQSGCSWSPISCSDVSARRCSARWRWCRRRRRRWPGNRDTAGTSRGRRPAREHRDIRTRH